MYFVRFLIFFSLFNQIPLCYLLCIPYLAFIWGCDSSCEFDGYGAKEALGKLFHGPLTMGCPGMPPSSLKPTFSCSYMGSPGTLLRVLFLHPWRLMCRLKSCQLRNNNNERTEASKESPLKNVALRMESLPKPG